MDGALPVLKNILILYREMEAYDEINKKNNKLIHKLSLKLESSNITIVEKDTLFKLLYGHVDWLSYKYHINNKNNYLDVYGEIEDFTQDIMIKILDKLYMWNSELGRFTTWIYTMARHQYICKHQSLQTQAQCLSLSEIGLDAGHGLNVSMTKGYFHRGNNDIFVETKDPLYLLLLKESNEMYRELINLIDNDPSISKIFKDYIFKKHRGTTISERTGINVNTIKTKIFNDKKKIRKKYREKFF